MLDSIHTAARLAYLALMAQIRETLADASVQVPQRLVRPLPGGGSLFDHEAGDLLHAGLDVSRFPDLRAMLSSDPPARARGPVPFKSCGWAGWDLAAAWTALAIQE